MEGVVQDRGVNDESLLVLFVVPVLECVLGLAVAR